jgi:MscS family membrane protein
MLEFLNIPWLLNPYLESATIFIAFYILSEIAHFVLNRYIKFLTRKTKTDVDDKIIEKTNRPVSLLLIIIGTYLAFTPFRTSFKYINIFENIVASVFILVVTYIVVAVIDVLIQAWGERLAKKTDSRVDDDLLDLFHRFSRIALFLIGIMFILPVWGIQIGPLLASLGIAGLAIAFALQATLGNIFGGVSMIIDKAVKVDDVVELEGGVFGTVTDVGLRSTRIRTFDNEMVVMPNGKLADMKIINHLQPDSNTRGTVLFGIAYGSDVEKAKKIVKDAASKVPEVLKDPAVEVQMVSMGDFALNFKATFWVNHIIKRHPTKAKVTEAIYHALNDADIEIPFPTRTIIMKGEQIKPK